MFAQMTICVSDKEENIMGKGKNAGHQHFLLFPLCFERPIPQGRENQGLFGESVKICLYNRQ